MTKGRDHHYEARVTWTGGENGPARTYTGYSRDHRIEFPGKPPIEGSSDAAFRGDPARCSPEELLLAALSACHMLWYLHLCTDKGVEVVAYEDRASGTMADEPGAGRFTEVVLRPRVTIGRRSSRETALALHEDAHRECFIANSVNFPVRHEAEVVQSASTV